MKANDLLGEFVLIKDDLSNEAAREWIAKWLTQRQGGDQKANEFLEITWEKGYEMGMWNLSKEDLMEAVKKVLPSN